jgi:RNA polymerase sigma factor (sigma-70 family)
MRAKRPSRGASLTELEELYRARLAEFRRVAAAIVGDRDAAPDVVQDAFGAAIRSRGTFRRTGPLEAWVWRIVVNEARDYRARPPEHELREPASENGQAEFSGLSAAIATLPERQRLAVFLRYYADLDYRNIGEALGVEPGTVAATLNAARSALRSSLQEAPR